MKLNAEGIKLEAVCESLEDRAVDVYIDLVTYKLNSLNISKTMYIDIINRLIQYYSNSSTAKP